MVKICKVCKIEKDDTCYSATFGKTGERYLMKTCKECLKAKRRNKPIKAKQDKTPLAVNETIETRDTMINEITNEFTDKEILTVVLNKNQRIHTVFNLDKDVRDKIKEFAANRNLNMSDVANLIFKKYFKLWE